MTKTCYQDFLICTVLLRNYGGLIMCPGCIFGNLLQFMSATSYENRFTYVKVKSKVKMDPFLKNMHCILKTGHT